MAKTPMTICLNSLIPIGRVGIGEGGGNGLQRDVRSLEFSNPDRASRNNNNGQKE